VPDWLPSDRELLIDLITEALSGPCGCDEHDISHDAELVVRALEGCGMIPHGFDGPEPSPCIPDYDHEYDKDGRCLWCEEPITTISLTGDDDA
jgi:hypothetical protein